MRTPGRRHSSAASGIASIQPRPWRHRESSWAWVGRSPPANRFRCSPASTIRSSRISSFRGMRSITTGAATSSASISIGSVRYGANGNSTCSPLGRFRRLSWESQRRGSARSWGGWRGAVAARTVPARCGMRCAHAWRVRVCRAPRMKGHWRMSRAPLYAGRNSERRSALSAIPTQHYAMGRWPRKPTPRSSEHPRYGA